jgi:hypothetical protein
MRCSQAMRECGAAPHARGAQHRRRRLKCGECNITIRSKSDAPVFRYVDISSRVTTTRGTRRQASMRQFAPRPRWRVRSRRRSRRLLTCSCIRRMIRMLTSRARDRYECHRWATEQSGFDSTQPAGVPAAASTPAAGASATAKVAAPTMRQDYLRAQAACLEGRGYSVK